MSVDLPEPGSPGDPDEHRSAGTDPGPQRADPVDEPVERRVVVAGGRARGPVGASAEGAGVGRGTARAAAPGSGGCAFAVTGSGSARSGRAASAEPDSWAA